MAVVKQPLANVTIHYEETGTLGGIKQQLISFAFP